MTRPWFLLLGLLACGDDAPADSDTAPSGDDDDSSGTLCEVATEPVTWESFAEGFFLENCQPCHASDSPDRNGAPADITFDTEEDVSFLEFAILQAATGPNPSMPPEGGVSDEDRELLQIYLSCP